MKEIFERETKDQLHIRIIPPQYQHIAIAMTKVYIKSISAHFEKEDALWDRVMFKDFNDYIYMHSKPGIRGQPMFLHTVLIKLF